MKKKRLSKLLIINIFLVLGVVLGLLFILTGEFRDAQRDWLGCLLSKTPVLRRLIKTKYQNEILRFAVIGDPQVKGDNELNLLKKALVKAKEEEVEFVVIVGDISQDGSTSQLRGVKRLLDESGINYYTLPGNHDVMAGRIENYEQIFGEPYRKAEVSISDNESRIKRTRALLLDNSRLVTSEQQLDDQQMVWLENELYKKPKDPEELVLVFMHFPLDSLWPREKQYLNVYFCAGRIDGLFAGHIHNTEKFYAWCSYPPSVSMGDYSIPVFNVGTIGLPAYNELQGFKIFHYFEGGQIEEERIVIEDRAAEPKIRLPEKGD